ncbi:HAMP domain-containing histidine kinase [Lachnospiraceae bacterium ZAX-1]
MKKFQYSPTLKGIAILLQEVFAAILVISIVLVTMLFDRNILSINDLKQKSFIDSGYYEQLFRKSADDVLNFIQLRERFETNGVYDQGKQVAIDENRYLYRLEDLVNWSNAQQLLGVRIHYSFYITNNDNIMQRRTVDVDGTTIEDEEVRIRKMSDLVQPLQEQIINEVEYYYGGNYELGNENEGATEGIPMDTQDAVEIPSMGILGTAIQKLSQGGLYELDEKELGALLKEKGMVNFQTDNTEEFIIREDYLPLKGNGIMESFLHGEIDLEQMEASYRALISALNEIEHDVDLYKKNINKYNKNETNLSYYISESETKLQENLSYYIDQEGIKTVYTNIKDKPKDLDLLDYGEGQGGYLYYNKDDMHLATNIAGMEEMFYNRLKFGESKVAFIAVSTAFPYEDDFYNAMREYNQLQPFIAISIISAIISFLGCIICFIYLSVVSGKQAKGDLVYLLWIDRIKTEIMIALSVLGFVALINFVLYCNLNFIPFQSIEIDTQWSSSKILVALMMYGVFSLVFMGMFLSFYLSFARRVKAGTLWSGSALCWAISGIEAIFKNRKPATKVLCLFALQLVIFSLIAPLLISSNDKLMIVGIFLFLGITAFEAAVFFREGVQRNKLMSGIKEIAAGDLGYKIDISELKGDNKSFGEAINTIGRGLQHAVDDSMKNERLKADLITNVSHDIKTPLTSIINYVDLIKREDIQNERIQTYINVLDNKSQRLKQLTEDLVAASKVSSGNITLQMERINFVELVYQTSGECSEKFEARGLTTVTKLPKEPVIIIADGRQIWRVLENLYNNVAKYAMANTRVYVDMQVRDDTAELSIKNISEQALNIDASELTERFIRGDVSRSTEGSGLGLSIAKSLTELMEGSFEIYLDGDLFKVTVTFPKGK